MELKVMFLVCFGKDAPILESLIGSFMSLADNRSYTEESLILVMVHAGRSLDVGWIISHNARYGIAAANVANHASLLVLNLFLLLTTTTTVATVPAVNPSLVLNLVLLATLPAVNPSLVLNLVLLATLPAINPSLFLNLILLATLPAINPSLVLNLVLLATFPAINPSLVRNLILLATCRTGVLNHPTLCARLFEL